MCVCVIHSCFQEKASFIRTEKVFVIASFCCSYQTPHPPSPFFSFLIILLSFIIHLFTPEYSARVQSVIPSMTSSQSEHHRSHSLSGWFSHPVWRNTSKKGKRKKEKEIPSSSSSSSFASVASNRVCICFAFDWCGLWFAFLTIFLV